MTLLAIIAVMVQALALIITLGIRRRSAAQNEDEDNVQDFSAAKKRLERKG
jgi:hypothetical protein